MNPWSAYPLVRLIVPFLAGVLCVNLIPAWGEPDALPAIFLSVLLLASAVLLSFQPVSYRWRVLPGIICYTALFAQGVLTVMTSEEDLPCETHSLVAEVTEAPRRGPSTIRIIARLFRPDSTGERLHMAGKALIILRVNREAESLSAGDFLVFREPLTPIPGAENPHGFDAAAVYRAKGVFWQAWPDEHRWKKLSMVRLLSLKRFAGNLRDYLLDRLRIHHLQGDEFGVVAALLLGYTNELDPDLRKGYAASGAMHILAVSGMHVGIVYLFMETLLGFLNRNRTGKLIKGGLIILMIWSYAMVTGLAPPVFRAALMLSLVVAGSWVIRKPETINVVCASLFIMVAARPLLLWNLGFQFSYLAVTGIVFLYKPLVNLLPVTNRLGKKLWSLICVSLAAQAATGPLTLYAFHQFPNYFLLTNILVIPLVSIVIYTAIGILSFSFLPGFSDFIALVLTWLVILMNGIIRFIEGLPGSTTTGIFFSSQEMILLCLILLSGCFWLITRSQRYLTSILFMALAFSLVQIIQHFRYESRLGLVVFRHRNQSVYLFADGREGVCLTSDTLALRTGHLPTEVQTYCVAEKVRTVRIFPVEPDDKKPGNRVFLQGCFYRNGSWILFGGQKVLMVSADPGKGCYRYEPGDLVILRHNPSLGSPVLGELFEKATVVADASNTMFRCTDWDQEARLLRGRFHAVPFSGAYEVSFGKIFFPP